MDIKITGTVTTEIIEGNAMAVTEALTRLNEAHNELFDRVTALEGKASPPSLHIGIREPVAWQFKDHDGKWYNGQGGNHRANTEAAGYLVRELFANAHTKSVSIKKLLEVVASWSSCYIADEPTDAEGLRGMWNDLEERFLKLTQQP